MHNQDKIRIISRLITEDPDIYNDDDVGGGNIKKYEAEEIRLPNGDLGYAIYDYSVHYQGKYRPATRMDPPEYPEIRIKLHSYTVYDNDGHSLKDPASLQAAEDYYYEYVEEKLTKIELGF